METNTNKDPMEFSPFDAPVKDVKQGAGAGGIKMEQITDSELDGKKAGMNSNPMDAPEFVIPDFDKIPNMPGMGGGQRGPDPMAPGSANDPFTPPGGGTGADGVKMDPGFKKEFTEYTAKWLIDIFFRLVVAGFRQFAKIDRAEILIAIQQGHIDGSFLKYVDEANVNVERELNVTEDEKKFIIEPLRYFMEVKKIEIGPGWMVGGSLLMVVITLGIRAYEVKQQNKALLDRMIKESAEIRNGTSQVKKDQEWKSKAHGDPETVNFSEPTFSVANEPRPSSNDEVIEVTNPEVVPNENY